LISPSGTFTFTLPNSKSVIEFKILTAKDEELIQQEIEGLKKFNKESSFDITTRLKYQIISVDGNKDKTSIREFVESYLLAADSRALRLYIKEVSPDIDLVKKVTINGIEEDIDIPINLNFFWPDL
jgi:hypothetical protein